MLTRAGLPTCEFGKARQQKESSIKSTRARIEKASAGALFQTLEDRREQQQQQKQQTLYQHAGLGPMSRRAVSAASPSLRPQPQPYLVSQSDLHKLDGETLSRESMPASVCWYLLLPPQQQDQVANPSTPKPFPCLLAFSSPLGGAASTRVQAAGAGAAETKRGPL